MKNLIHILACGLCLSFASIGFAANAPAVASKSAAQLPKAQALVQAGKFKEAYALLQPLEFELAGNVQYDYLLGISAVNSGRPDRATIALERLVATNAGYGDARQWLGIAYFQSGDMARAKKEFNTVLAQKPTATAQVKATATQYLAAIKKQEDAKDLAVKKAQQPYLVGNVEMGYGHDSSIATIPENYDPAFLATEGQQNPTPPPIPSGVSDQFALLNLNMEGRVPFSSAGTYGFLSVDSNNRSYNHNGMMNSHTSLVKGGLNMVSKGDTYRLDVARRGYRQEGAYVDKGFTSNSSQTSVTADARFMMTQRDFWAFNLQYNTPRYSTTPDQNTNQTVIGTNYMHIFPRDGSPLVYLAMNHARDRAVREFTTQVITPGTPATSAPATTDVSRNTNTIIFYSQYSFIKDADVLGMWMKSFRKDSTLYARASAVDMPYGRDGMSVYMLGMNWRPAPNWIVHPQWMRIKNDSNLPLYSFQKTEYSLSLKREFK